MNFAVYGNLFPAAQIDSFFSDIDLTCELISAPPPPR